MNDNVATCTYCEQVLELGESRWAGSEPDKYWHYGCAEIARVTRPFSSGMSVTHWSKLHTVFPVSCVLHSN
jgi:hypothetical protein